VHGASPCALLQSSRRLSSLAAWRVARSTLTAELNQEVVHYLIIRGERPAGRDAIRESAGLSYERSRFSDVQYKMRSYFPRRFATCGIPSRWRND
jgi:hypothetical protein